MKLFVISIILYFIELLSGYRKRYYMLLTAATNFTLLITPPARRAWRSYKFAPFLFFSFFFRVESRRTAHG